MPRAAWTGLVLLFSAGSFLSVHVLPEVLRHLDGGADTAYALPTPPSGPLALKATTVRRLAIVAGMLTPLLLTGGEHHHHDASGDAHGAHGGEGA